ncbi:MAG: tyrosine-type recombinase/integrase [Verrucomicrobia bacterium]|nr:tyrosine-type recombinase/integrase [Verrucomicrobiota bacterium]
MASIKRHPRSPFWMACFSLPDGRRTTRSTGTTDKKEAQRVANHYEDTARDGKAKRLTESRARKTIADIFALANPESLPSSTIREFLSSWLKRKELEAGERTHARYATVVDQLNEYLGPRAKQDVTHLNAREISGFREHLSQRLSPGTVNIALKILRSALAQARREGLVDVNEGERVTLLKIRRTVKRQPFNEAQLRRLLAEANDEWRGMILFGIYSGLRLGDIATLTWRSVDLQKGDLALTTAKTGREQVLPLAKPLLRHLENMPAGDDPDAPLFPSAFAAKQRSHAGGTLSNQFHEILVKAKVADPRPHLNSGKGRSAKRAPSVLSFHSLRHTTTSMLKNAGVSDAVARDIIGHESAAVSANYTHIDQGTKRKALGKLPDVTT